jgi:glutamyl/glutaminyl-tRNA synthetase
MAGREFGDFVVWRKDGAPSYQLAVVVDDAATGITEVVRGADLLASTAQQILLYRALGQTPPLFFHCPLVTDADGRRLAKRAGAHSLKSMREAGQRVFE